MSLLKSVTKTWNVFFVLDYDIRQRGLNKTLVTVVHSLPLSMLCVLSFPIEILCRYPPHVLFLCDLCWEKISNKQHLLCNIAVTIRYCTFCYVGKAVRHVDSTLRYVDNAARHVANVTNCCVSPQMLLSGNLSFTQWLSLIFIPDISSFSWDIILIIWNFISFV